MLLLAISVGITVFLIVAAAVLVFGSHDRVSERLSEVAAKDSDLGVEDERLSGLFGFATGVTGILKPIRDFITANDEDLQFRLSLAGFRKAGYVEVYTASKMLLPVVAIVIASFTGESMIIFSIVGAGLGFFIPDLVVTQMIARRKDKIRLTLPSALDLLVICMEAGLGIDQALVRVGEEVRLTSPPLAEEFAIITREQRAGKPRVEAWRSFADRLDLDFVRQFVAMLIQTERFGTPLANALGQFADALREKRVQAAEELAAKTSVKLLFPLIVFIFPSLLVVLLGPAILNIAKALEDVML